jgi:hypothetical protein
VGDAPDPAARTSARWVAFVALWLGLAGAIGWVLAPLDMGGAPQAVADYYDDHRWQILVYCYSGTLGTALQVLLFVGLRQLVDDSPTSQTLARVGLTSMLIEIVGVTIAFSIFAAVAYREPSPETAQLLTDVGWMIINLGAGPVTAVGLCAFAVALTRSGIVGNWLVTYTAFVAGAHLLVAGAFARSGFLSPEGGIAFVVPLVFFSWFVAVGASLLRRAAR